MNLHQNLSTLFIALSLVALSIQFTPSIIDFIASRISSFRSSTYKRAQWSKHYNYFITFHRSQSKMFIKPYLNWTAISVKVVKYNSYHTFGLGFELNLTPSKNNKELYEVLQYKDCPLNFSNPHRTALSSLKYWAETSSLICSPFLSTAHPFQCLLFFLSLGNQYLGVYDLLFHPWGDSYNEDCLSSDGSVTVSTGIFTWKLTMG